jgi:diketogulonate reductase-like aldo/keto reductase
VVAIPRSSKVEHLSQNIEVFDFELSDDEMQQILAMGSADGRLTKLMFAPDWD